MANPLCLSSFWRCSYGFVDDEIVAEPFFKFERDTFANNANTIDRIDDRFDIRVEQVALNKLDHVGSPAKPFFSTWLP